MIFEISVQQEQSDFHRDANDLRQISTFLVVVQIRMPRRVGASAGIPRESNVHRVKG
jgi:hypothetical protein